MCRYRRSSCSRRYRRFVDGREAGQALRLPLSHREFDLAEVMDAAGDQSHLRWVLRGAWLNGDVTPLWPEGVEQAERETERPGGAPLTWAQMSCLAQSCHQVIDGRFTGYDLAGQPVLELHAIDSSYWVVWARDGEVLARFRTAFSEAETYDEPTPEPLRP